MSYAEEAAAHGAVYIEGIFTPAERISGGASWDEVFSGFCDGAAEARERTGVEVRLTPDIPRGFPLEAAMETARYAIKYRDRGVVGLGLGGPRERVPAGAVRARVPARQGRRARVGPPRRARPRESRRSAARSTRSAPTGCATASAPPTTRRCSTSSPRAEIVCDVCPVSNVRTRAAESLDDPSPAARCSRRACCARSAPTIPRCSTPISRASTKPPPSSASRRAPRFTPESWARSATTPPAAGSAPSKRRFSRPE